MQIKIISLKTKDYKVIPYINEVNNIFYNAHVYLDIHCTFKKSKNNLLHGEYYYAGITKDIKNIQLQEV